MSLHNIVIAACLLFSTAAFAAEKFPGNTFPADAPTNGAFPEDVFPGDFPENDPMFQGEEEFLISATGYSRPARLAPSVATVITAHEIAQLGATTVYEALESVPGLHVFPREDGHAPGISIRGIQTATVPEVLLLRNGLPVEGAQSKANPGGYRMPVANVARIEVIRGPGSAVHGADAFSGVINVITKDANEINGTTFGARTGSFDTQEVWTLHGEKYGDWSVAFSLELSQSDGDRDRKADVDFQTTLDGRMGTTVSLAPGSLETGYDGYLETSLYLTNGAWDIDLWHWRSNNRGLGPGVAQALDPEGSEDHEYYQLDIGHTNKELHPDWELKSRFSYVYQEMRRTFMLLPSGTTVPIGADGNLFTSGVGGIVTFTDGLFGNPDLEERKYTVELTALYEGMEGHTWRASTGYSRQEVETEETKNFGPGVIDGTVSPINSATTDVSGTENVYMEDQDRERWFLSIQNEWRFAKGWNLTAGVRYDQYDDFGDTINPRVALVWAPPMPITTKLMYGRAFRAPSLAEMYYKNNPAYLGDPDIDPETIDTLEFAFEYYPLYKLLSKLNIFYYDMDDTIDYLPSTAGVTATNTDGQRGYGFEMEVEWDVTNQLELRSNFAWQHSENKVDGSRVPDAPGRQFHVSANWNFMPHWHISSQANWIGGQKRAMTDARDEVDSYTLVDMTLRRKAANQPWELAVSARNLFDQNEEYDPSPLGTPTGIPGDYRRQGQSLYAEIQYHYR
ncbi:TonB-dependent receptor; Outer membrane receptor for ferrienterochelin and colicins [hydrothermal vent metagenome]|uniref:TonB-dependent receptor Outer membrane receptor for ferrienterochelin and colicins n=1 Tax=hydrothermal vent metagenome TaxID=652676 RepID=A0A3B1B0F5_9ZZZZ